MVEKGINIIPAGSSSGKSKQAIAWICKVCGKEGLAHHMRKQIEVNHLEGISIPCDYCDKTCHSRKALEEHKIRFHK